MSEKQKTLVCDACGDVVAHFERQWFRHVPIPVTPYIELARKTSAELWDVMGPVHNFIVKENIHVCEHCCLKAIIKKASKG